MRLTPKAIPVLKGQETVALAVQKIEPKQEKEPRNRHKQAKDKTTAPPNVSTPLFEVLRTLRRKIADDENKPAFLIFSDTTLHDMARIKPRSLEELLTVSGVGQHKLTHYGQLFLDALQTDVNP